MKQFINHNGKIFSAEQPSLSHENRSFRYGDALFETIRIVNRKPLFLKDHITRLTNGLTLMKMDVPANLNTGILEHLIEDLCKRNGIVSGGRARFTVYRNNGGYYAPADNRVSFLLEIDPLDGHGYSLNEAGLNIDIFQELKKTKDGLASIKSANSALYVIAGVYSAQKGMDDCVLINTTSNVIETVNSNLFAVRNSVLYTAPLEEGCIDGVMRKQVIRIAQENKLAVNEVPLPLSAMYNSDEMFLTNTIKGIQWVGSYKTKQYTNATSRLLVKKLNESIA